MSYQAQNWAVKIRAGSHVLKSVLLHLANFADQSGTCVVGQERLARDLEMSIRSVRDALSKLEAKGIISRTRQTAPDGSRAEDMIQLNHAYRQDVPVGPSDQPASPAGSQGNQPASPAGRKASPTGTSCRAIYGYREDTSLRSVSPSVSPPSNVVTLKRKTRLTEAFSLEPAHFAYAARHGLSEQETRHEHEKFHNHFAGSGATKLDWNRTFQNWLIRAAEQRPRQAAYGGGRPQTGTVFHATQRFIAHVQAARVDDGRDEMDLPF